MYISNLLLLTIHKFFYYDYCHQSREIFFIQLATLILIDTFTSFLLI